MCRFAEFIHSADFPSEHKLHLSGKRINIWCGDQPNSVRSEQTNDIAEETDGAFDVLDDFISCD